MKNLGKKYNSVMPESPFENLKNSADAARAALAESSAHLEAFPPGIIGNGFYTVSDARVVLENILQTVDLTPQDEEICMRYMSLSEIKNISKQLSAASSSLSGQAYEQFVPQLESLVIACRPLDMLFMEKMDRKRYSEAQDLNSTLLSAQKLASAIKIISEQVHSQKEKSDESVEKLQKLITTVQELIDRSQENLNKANEAHGNATDNSQQINAMHNDAQTKKAVVDEFFELIQQRTQELADQASKTKYHEEKLKEHQEEHATHVKNYEEEYRKMLETAQELIDSAKEALGLRSTEGMSAAFLKGQRDSGHPLMKFVWLFVGLAASVGAICMGWQSLIDVKDATIGPAFIAIRAFLLFIPIGIAVFAARQYAKNRSIEEDYAYKAALIGSYQGIAKQFGEGDGAGLRDKYTLKVMSEVLQDPQRVREKPKPERPSKGDDKNE